jgi:membrane-associated protein
MDMSFLQGDLIETIRAVGYAGVAFIVFAESGLFFGFFLPGDSMLFTAGLLASQGFFNIYVLATLTGLAAVVGDSVGYWFGTFVGPAIFPGKILVFSKKVISTKRTHFMINTVPRRLSSGGLFPLCERSSP